MSVEVIRGHAATVERRVPLQAWAAVISTLCMLIGWNWDISWHRSIGRDTVWTLAHVAIYAALAIAFLYNAGLVLSYTFGRERDAPAIRVLGFRGPSGAFVTLWAILLQFVAILFDNWWHEVFGLDNAVFSPPHFALALAISIFYFGQFMLVAVYHNKANGSAATPLRWIAILIWSLFIGHQLIGMDPQFGPMAVRSQAFLVSCAVIIPFSLLVLYGYLRTIWAGVICGALYVIEALLFVWIFPLFPATPKFGPVFVEVSYLLPPSFPILIFVPALLMGWILSRREGKNRILTYLLVGAAFVVVFTGVNWLTSGFIMSPLAENRIFMGDAPASAFYPGYKPVTPLTADTTSAVLALIAIPLAAVSSFAGVATGNWLRRVVR